MRLNIINRTAIVYSAMRQANVLDMSPRFGTVTPLSDEAFKYSLVGVPQEALIVERVSLEELFRDIPQDITGITFSDVPEASQEVDTDIVMGRNPDTEESVVVPGYEVGADEYSVHFCNWKRLVGISDLPRSEVNLALLDDQLIIDAAYSTLYRGSVSVKVK